MAVRWSSMGAERLHVVDLDGARTGEPRNAEVIARIVDALDIPVQLGGGIRTVETAERMLKLGIDRVIVGTSAVLDSILAAEMCKALGEHLVIDLAASFGMVAIRGWQEILDRKAVDVAKELEDLGARRIIHTDVSADGMLKGVNLVAMESMARAVHIPIIASGGVTSLDDILSLRKLEPLGIEAVITGKALYTNSIDLREAIEAARDTTST
jgi:phosphoribosylformimino-5-aminoimidazole carboxamide ribotide isomerase